MVNWELSALLQEHYCSWRRFMLKLFASRPASHRLSTSSMCSKKRGVTAEAATIVLAKEVRSFTSAASALALHMRAHGQISTCNAF